MTQQEYYDLGSDTERWWRRHTGGIMPHLRHTPRCRSHDFKGTFEGDDIFIDVKFLRTPYRVPGWIEVRTWGKLSGIISTARDNMRNPRAGCYIAVLAEGRHYLIDAKALLSSWEGGELILQEGRSTDDNGDCTENKHFVMKGWNDPRYCVIEGPLDTGLWNPSTPIGKTLDMAAWMEGGPLLPAPAPPAPATLAVDP